MQHSETNNTHKTLESESLKMATLRDLVGRDPRETAHSFTSAHEASLWANEVAERLWDLGGSLEAKAIRRAFTKVSSMVFTAVYWKPRINLGNVIPGENRMCFNDMNLHLFKWMDNILCKHEKSHDFIAGPRESGKTLLSVEIASIFGALPALTKDEIRVLRESGVTLSWNIETKISLGVQWYIYMMIISDTGAQAEKHAEKIRGFVLGDKCLMKYDWPDVCELKVEEGSQRAVRSSVKATEFASNLRIEAFGITSGMLGSRHESARPGYVVLDDIEPGMKWSPESAMERRESIHDVVFPLSRILRCLLIETPQTEGSISDTLVRYHRDEIEVTEDLEWVTEWNTTVIEPWREDGETFWEGVIEREFLLEQQEKTTWGVSYASKPAKKGNQWFTRSMFKRVDTPDVYQRIICYVDPKKMENKGKRHSWTSAAAWAISAWTWNGPYHILGGGTTMRIGKGLVEDVLESMLSIGLPFDALIYESNAVGDDMRNSFRSGGLDETFGISAIGYWEQAKKEDRARSLYDTYDHNRVVHVNGSPSIRTVENGLVIYRGGKRNSDMVDAVGGAIFQASEIRDEIKKKRIPKRTTMLGGVLLDSKPRKTRTRIRQKRIRL